MKADSFETAEVVRLPLWKACVEQMLSDGVEYGKIYPAKFFEDALKQPRDSMAFALDVSEIRRFLEHKGFYLSGRGQYGEQFVIQPPAANTATLKSYERSAIDSLRRGVILGANTKLELLSPEDRRKHEKTLERIAIREALVSRPRTVLKSLGSKRQKALGK